MHTDRGSLVRNTHNDIESQTSIDFRQLDRMDADLKETYQCMHLNGMETNFCFFFYCFKTFKEC